MGLGGAETAPTLPEGTSPLSMGRHAQCAQGCDGELLWLVDYAS